MSRPQSPPSSEIVSRFLRGQNLEQVGRTDEAAAEYEFAVTSGFDAAGPYDRLIAIYSARAEHRAVVRIATAALDHVRTHDEKRAWYEQVRTGAEQALHAVPRAQKK